MPPDAIDAAGEQAAPEGDPQAGAADGRGVDDGPAGRAAGDGATPGAQAVQPEGGEAEGAGGGVDFDAILGDAANLQRILDHPALSERLTEIRQTERNAGAQSREAQLRREAGTRDRTKQAVERLLGEWGVDAESVGESGVKRTEFAYALAETHAADSALRALAQSAVAHHGLSEADRQSIEATLERIETLQDLQPFADQLWGASVDAEVGRRVSGLKLSEVPEGSQLHNDINAEIARRLEDEIKAAQIEGKPQQQAPPRSPNGNGAAPAVDTSTYRGIAQAVLAGQISEEDGRKAWNAKRR